MVKGGGGSRGVEVKITGMRRDRSQGARRLAKSWVILIVIKIISLVVGTAMGRRDEPDAIVLLRTRTD